MKKESLKFVIWLSVSIVIIESIFLFYQQNEVSETEKISLPSVDYWLMFAKIKKERRYIEEVGAHYRIPVFTSEIQDLSGQEIILSGYFLPYSKLDSVIILSRYPNASCFYCGLAGIESVAMVEVGEISPRYRMDQRLIVKGKLTLNSTNIQKLAFVIENALVEEL